jgi:hypothetical protein
MNIQKFNWQIWAGFLITFFGLLSYPFVFVRWPVTRDFPWANILIIAIAAVLLIIGLRRAFARGSRLRSKIVGSVLALLSLAFVALFAFAIFVVAKQLPKSSGAPQVGQRAPDFSLTDTNNKRVTLAELLSAPVNGNPPKGVLLIFYRGYW